MKYYSVNAVHRGSICEEVLRLSIECDNAKEATEILENYGYSVIDIDDEFEKIRVWAKE